MINKEVLAQFIYKLRNQLKNCFMKKMEIYYSSYVC